MEKFYPSHPVIEGLWSSLTRTQIDRISMTSIGVL